MCKGSKYFAKICVREVSILQRGKIYVKGSISQREQKYV